MFIGHQFLLFPSLFSFLFFCCCLKIIFIYLFIYFIFLSISPEEWCILRIFDLSFTDNDNIQNRKWAYSRIFYNFLLKTKYEFAHINTIYKGPIISNCRSTNKNSVVWLYVSSPLQHFCLIYGLTCLSTFTKTERVEGEWVRLWCAKSKERKSRNT